MTDLERARRNWPTGSQEMARRIREHGWAATPLGPLEGWPSGLRSTVNLMLAMPGPAIIFWGPRHVQVYNDAYVAIARDQHPALLGRPRRENRPELHPEVVASALHAAFAGHATRLVDMKESALAADGRLEDQFFDICWTPIRDDAGAVGGALETFVEVDARGRALSALRESEARHRLLIETWTQAVWETDAQGIVVADSPSWRAYTGQTLEELLGYGWLDAIHSEDRAYAERQWQEAVAARESVDAEFRLRAPSGAWRWTNVRATPVVDARGNIEKWVGINIDIDARKRAETALQKQEAKYRALYQGIDEGFCIIEMLFDGEGRPVDYVFLEMNPVFERQAGFSIAPGQRIREIAPEHEQHWFDIYGHVARSGEPARFQHRAAAFGVFYDVYAFRVDEPEQRRVAVLFRDITARQIAEAQLRESEERFRQFGEASSDVLWMVEATTGRMDYLSPAFDRVWGVPRESIMTDLSRWVDMLHPDDRQQALTALPRALAGETVIEEYRIVRSDGEVRYITDVGFPIHDQAGRIVRVGGIAQDRTQQREAEHAVRAVERRQRALIEGVPQLVWRAVNAGHWTWASRQWTAYTGQAETDSHDWGWLDPMHPDDRERTMTIWAGASERGEFHAEYRLRHACDGRYRWFQTRATPVHDDAGHIVEWLGTSTDIDELRELQERQKVLVAELQHRTRNLMGVIRAMFDKTARASTDLMQLRISFDERLESLARVQGLLSRLRDLDRVTFDDLIRSELSALHGGEDRVTLAGPTGVRLRSSTVQTLAMALHELATNAVKYGALGQPAAHLTVTWAFEPSGEGSKPWLHVDWRETGVVMPPSGTRPTGTGQGRELIEKALPYQFDAKTSYTLEPDGVHCTISIQVSATADGPGHA